MSRPVLYECEICGGYHPWDWAGDCRDDTNRYADPEQYEDCHGITRGSVEVRSMEQRVQADRGEM